MRRITRETTHFELVRFQTDLANCRWSGDPDGISATLVGSRIYMLGQTTDELNTEVKLCYLDLISKTSVWESVETPDLGVHYAFLVNDSFLVITEQVLYELDLILAEWTPLPTRSTPPCYLVDYVCAFVEESRRIIFFGGEDGGQRVNPTYAIGVDSLEWRIVRVTGKPPSARDGYSACSMSRKGETIMFVFGGRVKNVFFFNDLHALHCYGQAHRWSQIKLQTSLQRVAYSSIVNVSGMLFIYGGFNSDLADTDNLVRYDIYRGTCSDFTENQTNPNPISLHKALAINDAFLLFDRMFMSTITLVHAADTHRS